MKYLRILIHLLSALSLLVSACGPSNQPVSSDAVRTPATTPAVPTISLVPAATLVPSSPLSAPSTPTATNTPLARTINERPTPLPAPNCFPERLPPITTKDFVTSIAVASTSSMLVSHYTPANPRTTIFASDDNGLNWSAGRTFNDFIGRLVPSPAFTQDRIVFAVGAGGVYRSLNGGNSWSTITPSNWFTTTPLLRQFSVSPAFATDHTILLGSRNAPRGVFASTDGGATWIDWLVDSVDVLLISPNYAIDRSVWVARNDDQTFRRDVLVTFTQGDNWEFVRAGSAQPFAISPAYAQDSTIIWSDPTGGLFFSRNSDKVSALIEKADAEVLKVWQFNPQSGWVVTGESPLSDLVFSPNFVQDRTAFATTDQVMLITRDGGASWAPLCYWGYNPQKPEALRFNHLAISQNFLADQTLFAGGSGARIVVSHDAGRSWSAIPLK